MGALMIVLICIDVILLVGIIAFIVIMTLNSRRILPFMNVNQPEIYETIIEVEEVIVGDVPEAEKTASNTQVEEVKEVVEEAIDEVIKRVEEKQAKKEQPAVVEEVKPQPVEEKQPEPVEEKKVEKKEKATKTTKKKVEPVVEEVKEPEDNDQDDAIGEDSEAAKRVPFAQKLLAFDDAVQSYYVGIDNAFRSMRKINPRVSTRSVSYRLGRDLVAKLTIRGKTMRLHLALDVNAFPQNIYFQKDLSETKSYIEVPFTVKVKSERGYKNALKLIEAMAQEKAIEKKTRYTEVDSLAILREFMENN